MTENFGESRLDRLGGQSPVLNALRGYLSRRTGTEIVKDVGRRGPVLLGRLRGLIVDRYYDYYHHVDTCGSIGLDALSIRGGDARSGALYDALPARSIRSVVSRVPEPHNEWTLVDLGSGKGRVVLVAAERGFRRVIGVEFAQELHEIAEKNIEHYRGARSATSVRLLCLDAAEFGIPSGKVAFFLFSPFGPDVLKEVLDNIERSWFADPREMCIVYVTDPLTHPIPEGVLAMSQVFTLTDSGRPGPDPGKRYPLYFEIYRTAATA